MHDKIETDAQKKMVNAEILNVSERLLDFSRNDSYRSYANYNLAVYYSEQVNLKRSNEQDIKNAEKSKWSDFGCVSMIFVIPLKIELSR